MKKINLIFFIVIVFSINSLLAQQKINDYKYVLVPSQFDFFSEPDEYQLNSLTKFLLNKENFIALINTESFPDDLANNKCLALNANVIKHKSFLKSKLQLELKNCKNDVVFTTSIGESREKEYKKSYHEALRNAFKSFKAVNYKYTESSDKKMIISNAKEVESVPEITTQKVDLSTDNSSTDTVAKRAEDLNIKVQQGVHKETTPEVSVTQPQLDRVFYVKINKDEYRTKYDVYSRDISSKDNHLFVMYKTILNDVYIFKYNQKSGTIMKRENGNWIMEYIENDTFKVERIKVVFE